MVSGLQPQSYSDFIVQRSRWAQGMMQLFLLKNPLFKKGLRIPQRLCYLNSMLYWFFPFIRIVFLLSPSCFLLFNLKIYKATGTEFLAYALPHILASILIFDKKFGKYRWFLVSEIYELVQTSHIIGALTKVFFSPKKPRFVTTPKGGSQQKDLYFSFGQTFLCFICYCFHFGSCRYSKAYFNPRL